jgi:hypothetical protein
VPKICFGLERRQILTAAPSSPRFIRHRRRFGDDAANSAISACFHFVSPYIITPTDVRCQYCFDVGRFSLFVNFNLFIHKYFALVIYGDNADFSLAECESAFRLFIGLLYHASD